jgi:hypothetical protein
MKIPDLGPSHRKSSQVKSLSMLSQVKSHLHQVKSSQLVSIFFAIKSSHDFCKSSQVKDGWLTSHGKVTLINRENQLGIYFNPGWLQIVEELVRSSGVALLIGICSPPHKRKKVWVCTQFSIVTSLYICTFIVSMMTNEMFHAVKRWAGGG